MQRIRKGKEPQSLAALRRENPQADWDDDYNDKQTARLLLCAEQGSLCCFCLGRITPSAAGMKVAHFVPKGAPPSTKLPIPGLTWTNLFGACKGNERRKDEKRRTATDHHCDTRQKDQILHGRLNPCHYQPGTLRFDHRGQVIATNPELQEEVDQKLGLNLRKLREARLLAFQQQIVLRFPEQGTWSVSRLEQAIRHLDLKVDGRLTPYYVCIQDMLKRKLAAGSKKTVAKASKTHPRRAPAY